MEITRELNRRRFFIGLTHLRALKRNGVPKTIRWFYYHGWQIGLTDGHMLALDERLLQIKEVEKACQT